MIEEADGGEGCRGKVEEDLVEEFGGEGVHFLGFGRGRECCEG